MVTKALYDPVTGRSVAPAHIIRGATPMRETIEQARRSDRTMDAARTPAELRDAVHDRRLVRARHDFEAAMRDFEERNPVPVLVDRFPIVI
jgi:hypothetical protein